MRSLYLLTRACRLPARLDHANFAPVSAPHTQVRTLQTARRFHGSSSQSISSSGRSSVEDQSRKGEVPDEQPPSTTDSTKAFPTIIQQTAMLADPSLTDAEKLATLTTELNTRPLSKHGDALTFKARAEKAEEQLSNMKEAHQKLTRDMEFHNSMTNDKLFSEFKESNSIRDRARTLVRQRRRLQEENAKLKEENFQVKTKLAAVEDQVRAVVAIIVNHCLHE